MHKTKFEKKKTVLWGTITWSEKGNKTYKLKTSIKLAEGNSDLLCLSTKVYSQLWRMKD